MSPEVNLLRVVEILIAVCDRDEFVLVRRGLHLEVLHGLGELNERGDPCDGVCSRVLACVCTVHDHLEQDVPGQPKKAGLAAFAAVVGVF
ncbi:hypothetical protein HWD35_10555 [Tsukamurella tyrosinosolvens]|uniref:hypothetical protein n=1 Tax=Tsukamurella tyrosinosolvens TaxID=57704 RepID=UPI001CE094EC|nr:hypothetical protein [Tsukamurella tyrosinosolvens]MCA4995153.1 hypothetical protein [Tsukamurella tyrosinosolvens]